MSNSDSEESFESADEGEQCTEQKKPSTTLPSAVVHDSEPNVATTQDSKNSKVTDSDQHENAPTTSVKPAGPCLPDSVASVKTNHTSEEQKASQCSMMKEVISDQLNNMLLEQSPENNSASVADHVKADGKSNVEAEAVNVQQGSQPKEPTPTRHMLRLERKGQHKDQKLSQKPSLNEKTSANTDQHSDMTQKQPSPSSSSWGWSSWGSSLLSTATSSMSTFTSHVSSGIGTVLETVEATLGAPPPEELAEELDKRQKEAEARLQGDDVAENELGKEQPSSPKDEAAIPHSDSDGGGIGSLFSGVSTLGRVIESTGSKVISGGLDTLEMIGRKTIDLLTEGDPGLRQKRSLLSGGSVSLSQVLREAREKAEATARSDLEETEDAVHYSKLFDDFQGLVHLEALEMLSSESRVLLKSHMMELDKEEAVILEDICDELRMICEDVPPSEELDEVEQDFPKAMDASISSLHVKVNAENLNLVQKKTLEWLKNASDMEKRCPKEIHCQGVTCLAELTARAMEFFHKVGELLLVENVTDVSPQTCAVCLTNVSQVLCAEVNNMSARFSRLIFTPSNDPACPELENEELTTNLYLEASNSTTYIQDGFLLLIPVLQLRAVKLS